VHLTLEFRSIKTSFKGTPERPLDRGELGEKFPRLTQRLGREKMESLRRLSRNSSCSVIGHDFRIVGTRDHEKTGTRYHEKKTTVRVEHVDMKGGCFSPVS
jgi:hypothetical protein